MMRAETLSYPVSIFIAGDDEQSLQLCREHCDEVGLCVTVTPTTYVYTGGQEAGVVVGLINYGRFPAEAREIFEKARVLAMKLLEGLGQESCSIQAPDKTVWIAHARKPTP